MILWSASSIGKRVSLLGVLAVSVWLLTGTPADGQATTAPATSAAAAKKTIQLAQDRLLALGYLFGTADGVMGEKTTAALKNFQSAHGLPVTGQLDRKTLAALDAPPPAPTVWMSSIGTRIGKPSTCDSAVSRGRPSHRLTPAPRPASRHPSPPSGSTTRLLFITLTVMGAAHYIGPAGVRTIPQESITPWMETK